MYYPWNLFKPSFAAPLRNWFQAAEQRLSEFEDDLRITFKAQRVVCLGFGERRLKQCKDMIFVLLASLIEGVALSVGFRIRCLAFVSRG